MKSFKYSFTSAHPTAKELMQEEFYWSASEENGPYGNDDGWEAIEGFIKWRREHENNSTIEFLTALIIRWGYPSFDWNELEADKIKLFIQGTDLSEQEIQLKISDLKETFNNIQDNSSRKIDELQLRQMAIEMEPNLNLRILLGYDNAIIGTAFSQIALEGKLEPDLKYLSSTAIKRQLLPLLINNYEPQHKEKREMQLEKMLAVIENSLL